MTQCTLDPAAHYKFNSEDLIGFCVTYADHTLHTGNEIYGKLSE